MAQKKEWHRVAGLDPLEDNSVTSVAAGVKALCLVKFEGQYYALDNHCPHQGGPLGEGLIENGFVICPGMAMNTLRRTDRHQEATMTA